MAQSEQDLHTRESTLSDGRAVITRRIDAPTRVVWSVLADGWMYATWVVGASRVRLLEKARGWPAGEATVRIRVTPGGSRDSCSVSIVEDATSGPGKLLPRPARQLLIAPRNTESIRRLAFIAEGRHRQHTPGTPEEVRTRLVS